MSTGAAPAPPANRRAFGPAAGPSTPTPNSTPGAPPPANTSRLNASTSTLNRSTNTLNTSTSTLNRSTTALRGSTSSTTQTQTHLAPPLSSSPSSTSTASPTPPITAIVPGRARSQSSASGGAAAAAERASQWLAALAPRGEGRTREFITSSLSGVATVATTVGAEVNGLIKAGAGSRPGSFVGSPPEVRARAGSRARRDSAFTLPPSPTRAATSPGPVAPPPPTGGVTGPARIPRPANMSRLGHQSSPSIGTIGVSPGAAGATGASGTTGAGAGASGSPATSPTQPSFGRATLPVPPKPPSPSPRHTRHGSHSSLHSVGVSSSGVSPTPEVARVRGAGMPYKIGFQPSGVRHDRSAEFVAGRRAHAAEREKEEGRLGRRWAKLVDLHFNPATQVRPSQAVPPRKGVLSGGLDLDALNPKEVWKGLKMAAGPNPEEARKRAAEQTIVKWEADSDVRKCRICGVGFTLSTRKHHCRLCGRIVCSLPPTPPALLAVQLQVFGPGEGEDDNGTGLPVGTRREKCSILLVADHRTGRGQEVDEGFVGWMSLDDSGTSDPASAFRPKRGERGGAESGPPSARRDSPVHTRRSSASSVASSLPLPQQPQEVQVKGVRVCRECWTTVSRKQIMAERARVTPFQRLYDALRTLQTEIESALPDFAAELAAVKAQLAESAEVDMDLGDLVASHKQLLALLGSYDAIAKRIAALPASGAQAGVQGVLARAAATFLARAMVQVHEVPRLERAVAAAKAQHMVVVETALDDVLRAEGVARADDVARALQPLLEQQAQLESFIAEANAQRKYDDARSLAAALAEIEAEIGRLTASALE